MGFFRRLQSRTRLISALAIAALIVASSVAVQRNALTLAGSYLFPGKRPEALSHFGRPAEGVRSILAPRTAADRFGYLPTIEPVGDSTPGGALPTLALADVDGRRPRVIRLTAAGPVRVDSLPSGMDASLDRVRRLLTLAYLAESGADSVDGVQVDPVAWREFWSARAERFPSWVLELPGPSARKRAPVAEVLAAMAQVRVSFRSWNLLQSRLKGAPIETTSVRHFGMALTAIPAGNPGAVSAGRSPASERERIPAFVGWLRGGQPAVFTGAIADRDLARRWVSNIERASGGTPVLAASNRGCVDAVYAPSGGIQSIREVKTGRPSRDGVLKGYFQVRMKDGRVREFVSRGEIELREADDGSPILRARLPLEEYVARVVDRSGASVAWEAGKAVAALARAEALGWTENREGCRAARGSLDGLPFSLSPASSAARKAAAWTSEIAVVFPKGARERAFPDGAAARGSEALRMAESGLFFDEIIGAIGPGSTLGFAGAPQVALGGVQQN